VRALSHTTEKKFPLAFSCRFWIGNTLLNTLQTLLILMTCSVQDETDVIFHLRAYETRSVLLKHVNPDLMFSIIESQLVCGIPGLLQV
jgi:hypothetical protein